MSKNLDNNSLELHDTPHWNGTHYTNCPFSPLPFLFYFSCFNYSVCHKESDTYKAQSTVCISYKTKAHSIIFMSLTSLKHV